MFFYMDDEEVLVSQAGIAVLIGYCCFGLHMLSHSSVAILVCGMLLRLVDRSVRGSLPAHVACWFQRSWSGSRSTFGTHAFAMPPRTQTQN